MDCLDISGVFHSDHSLASHSVSQSQVRNLPVMDMHVSAHALSLLSHGCIMQLCQFATCILYSSWWQQCLSTSPATLSTQHQHIQWTAPQWRIQQVSGQSEWRMHVEQADHCMFSLYKLSQHVDVDVQECVVLNSLTPTHVHTCCIE